MRRSTRSIAKCMHWSSMRSAHYPGQMELLLQLLSVSRYLERIADHATNIAEDVIYMLKGDIVRHTMGSNSFSTAK